MSHWLHDVDRFNHTRRWPTVQGGVEEQQMYRVTLLPQLINYQLVSRMERPEGQYRVHELGAAAQRKIQAELSKPNGRARSILNSLMQPALVDPDHEEPDFDADAILRYHYDPQRDRIEVLVNSKFDAARLKQRIAEEIEMGPDTWMEGNITLVDADDEDDETGSYELSFEVQSVEPNGTW